MISRLCLKRSLVKVHWASLVAQSVKDLPVVQETWVQSLGSIPGSGGSLGEGNSTPLSVLAWKILWTEEPNRLQSMGWRELDTTW